MLDRNFLSTHSVQIALSESISIHLLFFDAPRRRTGKTTFSNATCGSPVSIGRRNRGLGSLPAPSTTMWYSSLAHSVSYAMRSADHSSSTFETSQRYYPYALHSLRRNPPLVFAKESHPHKSPVIFSAVNELVTSTGLWPPVLKVSGACYRIANTLTWIM